MNTYELRVFYGASRQPINVITFHAVDEVAALEHMRDFAATLPGDHAVWLYPAGGALGTSLGSEQGSAS